MQGIGILGAGSTLSIPINNRVGIAADATAVVLNVTVTQPQDSGFATVYPCAPWSTVDILSCGAAQRPGESLEATPRDRLPTPASPQTRFVPRERAYRPSPHGK